jgi:hypothetical protein
MSDIGLTTSTAPTGTDPQPDDIIVRLEGIPDDLVSWLPDTDMVGRILRARTRDRAGRLGGVFTTNTEPTDTQATELIVDAAEEIASALPSPLPDAPGNDPDALRKAYRRVVARLAAANIELGYPSTRGSTDRYDRLYKRYTDAKAILIEAVSEAGGGGGGLSVESEAPGPAYSFDEAYDDTIGGCSSHIPGTERPLPESWC